MTSLQTFVVRRAEGGSSLASSAFVNTGGLNTVRHFTARPSNLPLPSSVRSARSAVAPGHCRSLEASGSRSRRLSGEETVNAMALRTPENPVVHVAPS